MHFALEKPFSCSASGPSGTLTFNFPEGQDLRDPIILSLRADESDPCRLATCQRIKNTAPNYHGLCEIKGAKELKFCNFVLFQT